MASVGQMLFDWWAVSSPTTKAITLPGGTHPLVWVIIWRENPSEWWNTDPPFVFPAGWTNAINPATPHASVILHDADWQAVHAIPYMWTGGGSPGGTVVLDVQFSSADVLALQLSLEPGEVLTGWAGVRHENPEENDPLSIPGSSPANGLLVLLSHRTVMFPG